MNGHSMGSKQEALGAMVQQESYGTVATREMWWDDSMAGVPSGCLHAPQKRQARWERWRSGSVH